MFVNLKEQVVAIGEDEYQLIGLDEVGFMIDEDYQGRYRVFNTKEVLTVEPAIDDKQFDELCKAVEQKLNYELGWL